MLALLRKYKYYLVPACITRIAFVQPKISSTPFPTKPKRTLSSSPLFQPSPNQSSHHLPFLSFSKFQFGVHTYNSLSPNRGAE